MSDTFGSMNMALTLAAVILAILIFAYWYKYDYKKSDEGYGSSYGNGMDYNSSPSGPMSGNPCKLGFVPYNSGNGTMYCIPNSTNGASSGYCSGNGGWSPSAQAEAAALGNVGSIIPDDYLGERRLDYYLSEKNTLNNTFNARNGNSDISSDMGKYLQGAHGANSTFLQTPANL